MKFEVRHHAHPIFEHVRVYVEMGPNDPALVGELILSPDQWDAYMCLLLNGSPAFEHTVDITEDTHDSEPHATKKELAREH